MGKFKKNYVIIFTLFAIKILTMLFTQFTFATHASSQNVMSINRYDRHAALTSIGHRDRVTVCNRTDT